ncbi:MAG: amidohydrolase [Elusimicrobia bacterium]|nr:amidohydrolase [Elusimicrobiota bacterium]
MKIDVHTHILPTSWPDLEARYGYGGFLRKEPRSPCGARLMIGQKHFRDVEDNCFDPQIRMDECDRAGVRVQALSTLPAMFSYWANPKDGADLSRILNDHVALVVDQYPKRFVGLATVPLQAPELAVRELERCVGSLGFRGVQIGSHVNTWNLDEPALFPFFARAAELDAAVFVHPWDMAGADRMKKYWLPWLIGMPGETALAVCSMIFGGVFERLPKLKVCFAHGGGSFAACLGRIEQGFSARPDLCAVDNTRNPRRYVGRFYVDSLVHDAEVLKFILGTFGEDRILLGSDYPFPLGEDRPGGLIETMKGLTPRAKSKLLSANALEFLGLDADAFSP